MTFYELNNFVFRAIRCESTYFTFMLYFYMFVSNMLIECNILCSFIIKLKKCISDPRKKNYIYLWLLRLFKWTLNVFFKLMSIYVGPWKNKTSSFSFEVLMNFFELYKIKFLRALITWMFNDTN
jgi:hypothetical protein